MGIRLVRSREAVWVDLGNEAAVYCLPPTTMRVFAARERARAMIVALKQADEIVTAVGGRIEGAPDLSDDEHEQSAFEAMFIIALAELVITDWRNMFDDDDAPLAFDVALLSVLMEDEAHATAFLRNYLRPIDEVAAEKKG